MKIANRKLVENIGLVRQVAQKQLPVKASYTLSQNIDHIESNLKPYERERQKLLEKYAEKDGYGKLLTCPDGISIKFRDDAAEAGWKKDIEELLSIEVDVDIRRIKLSDLGNANFSAAEMAAIDYMIED
jgi:hypothetical protein